MPNLRRTLECSLAIVFLGLIASTPVVLAQQKPRRAASTKHKAQAKAKPKPTPPAPEPLPAPPEPQVMLTRSQLPPVPPRVEYRDGQLAIAAENSTLGDILRAVHQQTGAAVDIPANVNERVVAHLGPGPARDILATLLDGSNFNYVMLGSPTDATVVQRLIVSAKSGAAGDNAAVEPPPQGGQVAGQAANGGPYRAQTENAAEEASDPEVQAEEQAEEQPEPEDGAEEPPANQQQGNPAVKSPEQLLQELQRQQQQQPQRPQAAPQGFPVPPGQQMPPEQNQEPPRQD